MNTPNTPTPGLMPDDCAHCGANAEVVPHWAGRVRFYVQCEHCGVRTADFSKEAEAVGIWNTRTQGGKQSSHTAGDGERDAIAAFLHFLAERGWVSKGTPGQALHAAAHAVLAGEHSSFSVTCVGCEKPIGARAYVSDDDGVTGCPACFSEDGSGECWNRDGALSATQSSHTDLEAMRRQGQEEGMRAVCSWLRDRGATKPPATLWHAAEILANQFEEQRIPKSAIAQHKGQPK